MSPIVEVKDFSFKYRDAKRRAVKHVDFQVEEGSFFTIIGANGQANPRYAMRSSA